ncbi:UNVERIFIED_CONTAM: hypothetical protein GTU68_028815 [Idotea baltica]|nr:hypothetical protein [Idotea baltica]
MTSPELQAFRKSLCRVPSTMSPVFHLLPVRASNRSWKSTDMRRTGVRGRSHHRSLF